jgi:N-glycosylase/DNA lyase
MTKAFAKIIDQNTIHVYDANNFDIHTILRSGQVFRYEITNTDATVISGANIATITLEDDIAVITSNDSNYFWNYFDLDTEYNVIKTNLSAFPKLAEPISHGGGIRILRADFVETVISFIISANNNIKRFTKTINALCEKFGSKIPDTEKFAFPTLFQLATVTESDFASLGCGYRAPYLVKAITELQSLDIATLKSLTTADLYSTLLTLHGVGPKVANCIMLFSDLLPNEDRFKICPIDTHIKRAFAQLGIEDTTAILNHKFAGVAQQYIFYYLQHLKKDL